MTHRPLPARTRTLAALLTAALAGALLTSPAAADPAPEGRPDTPAAERRVAQHALEKVERALAHRPDDRGPVDRPRGEVTMLMLELSASLPDLAPADRAQARLLLARPTERTTTASGVARAAAPDPYRNDCTELAGSTAPVCVHWIPKSVDTTNGVAATDLHPANGVPDHVDRVRVELSYIWGRVVSQGGYRAPRPDAEGPDDRLDFYLQDLGSSQIYGYCAPDLLNQRVTPGYCVLDNDYDAAQYPSQTPLDNLRVTAGHEFFHAVQFAYDSLEDHWLMEGTAAWVEDELYDDIDDNLQYINGGPMRNPKVSLDRVGLAGWNSYSSWTWWRYLAEQLPADDGTGLPTVVREVWEGAVTRERHSMLATTTALSARGRNLTGLLAGYGEAKRHPADVFDEGAQYGVVKLMRSYTVAARKRTTQKTATLPHLTSQTFAFVPGARTANPAWRLRIPVDAPNRARGSHVQVSVIGVDGGREVSAVRLNKRGNGTAVTGFSSSTVRRVELTITNAGRRYQCWRGTSYACAGVSLDDGLRTKFRGVTFRD